MIKLNNIKFAINETEFINSLFETDGTCHGYYRVYKRRIVLMDKDKNRIGVIVNNVLGKATKQDNGKYWYSYATPELIGDYDYTQQQRDIARVYDQYPMPVRY